MLKSDILVCGIGTKGLVYPVTENKKIVLEYRCWANMLQRCMESYKHIYPTYEGIQCVDSFKYYPYFYEWCNRQIGFGNTDEKGKVWQLDKDLLVKGNKVYSEDTCVFLPHKINTLLTKRQNDRGSLPVGVSLHNITGKYQASCSIGDGKTRYLGLFLSVEEAFSVYRCRKESFIKKLANEYKDRLDPRAYQALMNYTVEITD